MSNVRVSSTETTVHVTWKEPQSNGSPILSYNIDISGEPRQQQMISVDADGALEYVVTDLSPETTYKSVFIFFTTNCRHTFCFGLTVLAIALNPIVAVCCRKKNFNAFFNAILETA